MPRRRKEAAARPRTVLIPPDERCWVESDAYDRSAFAALVAEAPSLVKVAEDGGTLVPHFRALLEDVFCLLFKLEPRLRPAEAVAPAAALNRTLLEAFHGHPLLEHLLGDQQRAEARVRLVESSEEHTSELQSHSDRVCRLLLEKKKPFSIASIAFCPSGFLPSWISGSGPLADLI